MRDAKRKRRDRIEPERSRVNSSRAHTALFDTPLTDPQELARRRARAWWWTADSKTQWVGDAATCEVSSDFPIDGTELGTSEASTTSSSATSMSTSLASETTCTSAGSLYDELSAPKPESNNNAAPTNPVDTRHQESCLSAPLARNTKCDSVSADSVCERKLRDLTAALRPAETPLTIKDRVGRVEPLHALRDILLDMPAAAAKVDSSVETSPLPRSHLFDRICAHFTSSTHRRRLVRIVNSFEPYALNSTPYLRGCIRSPITDMVVPRQARNCAQPLYRVLYWLCHNREPGSNEHLLTALGGEFKLVSRCSTVGCVNPQHYQHTCAKRSPGDRGAFALSLYRLLADDDEEPAKPLKLTEYTDEERMNSTPVELKFH